MTCSRSCRKTRREVDIRDEKWEDQSGNPQVMVTAVNTSGGVINTDEF